MLRKFIQCSMIAAVALTAVHATACLTKVPAGALEHKGTLQCKNRVSDQYLSFSLFTVPNGNYLRVVDSDGRGGSEGVDWVQISGRPSGSFFLEYIEQINGLPLNKTMAVTTKTVSASGLEAMSAVYTEVYAESEAVYDCEQVWYRCF